MTDRGFRFGVVAAQASGGPQWWALARAVRDAGANVLLVPDTAFSLSPVAACAVAATAVPELRVGAYVLSAPSRSPGQVALETASLDTLTDGRYELGIGPGRPDAQRDADLHERRFGTPAERLEQVAHTVTAVRERTPRVPVLVAAGGGRGLRQAGRIADTVALGLPPTAGEELLADAVLAVRAGAGRRVDEIELCQNLLAIGDDEPPWLPAATGGHTAADLAAAGSVAVIRGDTATIADELQRRRDKYGISYICTSAAFLSAFAPVIQRLAGR